MKTVRIIKSVAVLMVLCFTFMLNINAQAQHSANGVATNGAAYLSQSTPGEMAPGKSYGVSVTMKNNGTKVWEKGTYALKLMNANETIANTWGVSKVEVNSSVNPREEIVFNFSLTAPVTEGAYNMQWQMAEGNSFFGEPTMNVPIKVIGISVPVKDSDMIENNAAFLSQKIPNEMDTKETYDVTVVMKNNGLTTWKTGEFKLKVSTKGGDNAVVAPWEVANVELSSDVYANSEVTFNFKVTAPEKDGLYNLQTQLMKNGVFFGEPSTNVIVTVD